MKRMTDERLAEIENVLSQSSALTNLTRTCAELLQALKAEREWSEGQEKLNVTCIKKRGEQTRRIKELERSREQLDCRYAGSHWESSGSHCPTNKPCMRCAMQARLDAVAALPNKWRKKMLAGAPLEIARECAYELEQALEQK